MAVRGGTAVCVQGARGRELVSTSHMLVRASRWTSQAGQGHLAYGRTSQLASNAGGYAYEQSQLFRERNRDRHSQEPSMYINLH